jgi:phosphoribosylformimino-5-aminoimidazole carboxamide ribotide isomerase
MLTGVNAAATQKLAQAVSIPIIASGGVATIDDIEKLLPLGRDGVEGVIIGRALYAGAITLKEAISLTKGRS